METIITFIIAGITFGAGYFFGTKERPELKKEETLEEIELKRQEKITKNFQKLFDYNESIAARGYGDERE